jgi:hypothetical protein
VKPRSLFKLLAVLTIAFLPFTFEACSQQAVPTIIETPTPISLKFVAPTDFQLIRGPIAGQKVVPTNVLDEINLGPGIERNIVSELIEERMSGISELEIPGDKDTTFYEETVEFANQVGFLTGTKLVQIDFFPIQGVGEDCSGNTTPYTAAEWDAEDFNTEHPICARIWVDGERYLLWIIEQLYVDPTIADVTEKNVGKHKFWATFLEGNIATDLKVVIDHVVPENKLTEEFVKGTFDNPPDTTDFVSLHVAVTETGPEDAVVKRINMNYVLDQTEGSALLGHVLYLGQFLVGGDFWSGSINDTIASFGQFSNVCAELATGDVVDSVNCEDISVEGIDFVSEVIDADVERPADFSETPPSPPF